MKRKILLIISFMVFVINAMPFTAFAYIGNQFTENPLIAERLTKLFAEYQPNRSYFTSTYGGYNHSGNKNRPCGNTDIMQGTQAYCGSYDGKIQCLGFARYAQSVLFGKTEGGRVSGAAGGAKVNYTTVYYPSKSEIMKMPIGTHLRTYFPHSAILLQSNSYGITVLDCNSSWSCKVMLRYITWDKLTNYGSGLSGSVMWASYPSSSTYPKSKPTNIKGYITNNTKLLREPFANSSSRATAKKFDLITIINKGNSNYYFVRNKKGVVGYVSVKNLSSGTPPIAKAYPIKRPPKYPPIIFLKSSTYKF